jgi:hypothetical protein
MRQTTQLGEIGAPRGRSMYDRSDADEWHDDVFVSAIVRLIPKMEKAWAAPGVELPRARAGNWLGAAGQGSTADTARPDSGKAQ